MARIGKTKEIQEFILNNVSEYPKEIGRIAAEKFNVSRSAISKHLNSLIKNGKLNAKGATKARTYELRLLVDEVFELSITPGLQEDLVWRERIVPLLGAVKAKKTVIDICNHGFTEILNNAFDHSESKLVRIHIYVNSIIIEINIVDFGIGIFRKIQTDFHLNDPRHALLELAKGKLTSDRSKHSGEGIFFTSRMFDVFSILSGELYFARINKEDDWLVETENRNEFKGTWVKMIIDVNASQTAKEIFNRYAPEHDDYGFTKTHVPISLTKYDDDQLISRSAAKRLLARFNAFKEVWLDFKGVPTIGQAFADEIFRVYSTEHPEVKIIYSDASEQVDKMIKRAINSNENDGKQLNLIDN